MNDLVIRNRQRQWPVDLTLLRQIALAALDQTPPRRAGRASAGCELGVFLVGARQMARLNQRHLGHAGSTDVITFGYPTADLPGRTVPPLQGDIFISVEDARRQARRFRTTWTAEIVRYLVHGLLHLEGFDDLDPRPRRRMKREENRRVRRLVQQFPIHRLGRCAA